MATQKLKNTHHLHAIRVILLTVLLTAVGIVQIIPNGPPSVSANKSDTLAYATSISRSELLSLTNQSRSANGLSGLTLNGKLNNSAQSKAQHMVSNNYWAHVAPDGTQPWYFFEAAGYDYRSAGENLAYGFANSNATHQGWMNSSTHRDNIMGDYTEVGFGFVNGSDFQGNENTVVVAHYGKPINTDPAPKPQTPAVSKPVPTPAVKSEPSSDKPVAQPNKPKETVTEKTKETKKESREDEEKEIIVQAQDSAPTTPIATGTSGSVSVLQSALQGSLPYMIVISLSVVMLSGLGYVLTHRSLVQHAVINGEQFALRHPAFDMFAFSIALALILLTTIAQIQ